MRRRPGLAVLTLAVACTGVVACAEENSDTGVITIGVAAAPSLSAAFTELIGDFEADNPGVRVTMELGRSNEIAESLPGRTDINIFASASEEVMDRAVADGVAVDPQVFARNYVVLAVPSGNPRGVTGLKDLEREDLRVALCEVSVPCGRAASALLAAADVTPPAEVERAAGSRALTAQLADNAVDVGVVYRTDVASSHGWATEVDVDARDRELEQEAGTTRYTLARVPGGDAGPDAEAEAAAADEFAAMVFSSRGRLALQNSGLAAGPA